MVGFLLILQLYFLTQRSVFNWSFSVRHNYTSQNPF
nr:MAG TPA: small hydrophobic protein [Caudoviricetes sp.]